MSHEIRQIQPWLFLVKTVVNLSQTFIPKNSTTPAIIEKCETN